jgi:ubiquinone/menaquinone biosynthesis C-methylase UbiE
MTFSKFISKQSSKPSGLFGRLIMSPFFKFGNIELNDFVFDALSITDSDHLLEIGFGPGALINKVAKRLKTGMIEGIDISNSMVESARKKNKRFLKKSKVKLQLADIDTVQFDENSFDKIFSVNTVYFWKEPNTTISKICHLLKPGGRLFIGFHDKNEMETMSLDSDVFSLYSPNEISELLSVHSLLKDIQTVSKKGKHRMLHCVSGIK